MEDIRLKLKHILKWNIILQHLAIQMFLKNHIFSLLKLLFQAYAWGNLNQFLGKKVMLIIVYHKSFFSTKGAECIWR